ncbi:MAG: hypothetical protein SFV15_15175 [Polyangiaceae bacterium]|nr:hypothetical protein [Polyangiaceae bacterium]
MTRDEQATAKILTDDAAVSSEFFASAGAQSSRVDTNDSRGDKPTHYKVICISMYTDDLNRLDTMVDTLKSRGLTKANRSALIRYALGAVDLDTVPKGL